MTLRIFAVLAFAGITFSQCNTTKKNTAKNDDPAIQLDTISVTANEKPAKEVYRESNPVSNDLIWTELKVSFDWQNSRLNGKALLQLKPHFYSTRKLYLNARGMEIKRLTVSEPHYTPVNKKVGNKIVDVGVEEKLVPVSGFSYTYDNDSLKIDLGKEFNRTENYYVEIEYIAKPDELKNKGGSAAISSDKGLFFVNPKGENKYKMPQVWTQGETQANSVWFPTIDSPNSKTTQDLYITVDPKYTTLSNGLLVETLKNADGTKTDHWKMDLKHAPYLVMMAVGEFKKVVDEPWNGKEVSYYVEKEYEPHAKAIFGQTREMIDFYSRKLGVAYAWPKYAQVTVRDYVSGAMENTSATLHGDFVVYQTARELIDGHKGESVIAHELFHQWFGDLVTCESWSNLPLNESFATYGEYLWYEYKHGRDAADHHHAQSREGYKSSDKEVHLVRFNYENKEDMFDAFSYNKGGQVLHMLRKAVGDEAFFASLKLYLENNQFKSAEIHHLRLAFEEVTGIDMNWFFNQWFLSKGRPKLKVQQVYNPAAGIVELSVEQKQDLKKYPLYRLPVDVDVYVNGQPQRTRIWITEARQTFSLPVTAKPQLVNFDAERVLLADLEYEKGTDEYIFQYKNAPLYEDRMEALSRLESKMNDETVFGLMREAATGDKYHVIRNSAISKLGKASKEKSAALKEIYLSIYKNDLNTRARARALGELNTRFGKDEDVLSLVEKALEEQSYAICGQALEIFIKKDPKLAMEKAKRFAEEHGKDVVFPLADLYANFGGDEHIPFFRGNLVYMTGFEMLSFTSLYTKLGKRCSAAGVLSVAEDLETLGKGSNRFTKYGVQKGLKDLLSAWEGREKEAKSKLETAKGKNEKTEEAERELREATQTREALAKLYAASR